MLGFEISWCEGMNSVNKAMEASTNIERRNRNRILTLIKLYRVNILLVVKCVTLKTPKIMLFQVKVMMIKTDISIKTHFVLIS